jgi:hypothetical protein
LSVSDLGSWGVDALRDSVVSTKNYFYVWCGPHF